MKKGICYTLLIICIVGFFTGYVYGKKSSGETPAKEETAYDILQKGLKRINE